MASCVSKWLRVRSSVPAKAMKAACLRWYSGSTLCASAGCRPQSPPSSGNAPSGVPGRGMAMLGREA
ncbi:hypothetical protein D3C87_911690 [compost metagenome]